MTLSLIVAMTDEAVIGKDNKLPWHLSDDLKRFKQLTMGHPLIMGRKTFDSLGRPLPGRENVVITRDSGYQREGITVTHDLDEAIRLTSNHAGEVFVIGGASIYKLALPRVSKLYMTLIHEHYEGDTFFPAFDFESEFRVTEKTANLRDSKSGLQFSYVIAERVKKGHR